MTLDQSGTSIQILAELNAGDVKRKIGPLHLYRLVEFFFCNFGIQEIIHANNAKCYKKEFPLEVKKFTV